MYKRQVVDEGVGEAGEAGVDVLAAAFDQAVAVEDEGVALGEGGGGLGAGDVVGAGAERGVGGLVEEFDGAVGAEQGGRGMAGAAVGDGVGLPVDAGLDDGGVLGAFDGARVQTEDFQGLGGAVGDAGYGAEGAAEQAHDAGGVEAVAHDVADGDADAVAGQVDEVVPVAADVERSHGGLVAHGGPVVAEGAGGGQHRVLQGEGDLALAGVGLAEPFVELLQLPGPGVQLGLQHPGAAASRASGLDELGDLLDAVHQHRHPAVRSEHCCIDRAPVPFVPLARPFRGLHVVALQRHRVPLAGGEHPLE